MGFNTNKHNCQGPHIVFETGLKDPQKKNPNRFPKTNDRPNGIIRFLGEITLWSNKNTGDKL